ncbi:MAG: ABC transporter permease [Bacilli bacterium]
MKRKKVLMLCIILLVLLMTASYVAVNYALDQMDDSYDHYLNKQQVADIAVDVLLDLNRDVSLRELNDFKKKELKNMSYEEKKIISLYEYYLFRKLPIGLQNSYDIMTIFKKYGVDILLSYKKLDVIKNHYDFIYEQERSKTIFTSDIIIKAMPYFCNKEINKFFLIKGRFPVKDNEVTILPDFAREHNLYIGSSYKIGHNVYQVVGFAYASAYIYPLMDISNLLFNKAKNNIVLLMPDDFNSLAGLSDNMYALHFNHSDNQVNSKDVFHNDFLMKFLASTTDTIIYNDNTVLHMMRTISLPLEFSINRKFSSCFLYLLLGINVFIIIIIMRKIFTSDRLAIGILLSLGYNRLLIAFSYLVYPVVGSIVGGILGYFLGIILHYPLAFIYRNFYALPFDDFKITGEYFLISVCIPCCILVVISLLVMLVMLRKKPLILLKEGSNLKIGLVSRILNRLLCFLPFSWRFKYALAFASLGKLFIVFLISFKTGLIIVFILIGPNLFNNSIDKSFAGIRYDYVVMLNKVATAVKVKDDDLILTKSLNIVSINDGNRVRLISKNNEVMLSGYDDSPNYFKLFSFHNQNITSMLANDGIVISKALQDALKIKVGNTLVFNTNFGNISYRVIGVCAEHLNFVGYVNRNGFSKRLGLLPYSYNRFATRNNKYSSVLNLNSTDLLSVERIVSATDLKNSMCLQVKRFSNIIYAIVIMASFMAFIIMVVMGNMVISENKKIISLMKVMGYSNKKISQIVLTVYRSLVIFAYLLAIPCMLFLLQYVFDLLAVSINMSIDVSLSPLLCLIGFFMMMFVYYISLFISRIMLNKVPLAVVLKGE